MRFLLICLAFVFDAVLAAEPAEFRAEYVAEYRGLPVKARGVRELVKLQDNRYRFVSSASSLFAQVTVSKNQFAIVPASKKLRPSAISDSLVSMAKRATF